LIWGTDQWSSASLSRIDQPIGQEFAFDSSTALADGRQHPPSPLLRTALVERAYQQTARCADEIHLAGLPLAITHLAIAEPQLLLAVPMKRLGACPAVSIHQHRANHLSDQPITHQRFTRRLFALLPKQDNPHGMRDVRNPHLFTEVPEPLLPIRTGFLACQGIWRATAAENCSRPYLAVEFQEYLTGLMLAEKKTVSGINSAFVVTDDQSCFNR
jgi:hypothetical protein